MRMWKVEMKSGARFIKVSNSKNESFPSEIEIKVIDIDAIISSFTVINVALLDDFLSDFLLFVHRQLIFGEIPQNVSNVSFTDKLKVSVESLRQQSYFHTHIVIVEIVNFECIKDLQIARCMLRKDGQTIEKLEE